MKSPTTLGHKPIIEIPDYEKFEPNYPLATDVRALSIGMAQYDGDDISLKVWRHVNSKWSRQSEELPIHRNLDLTLLFVSTLLLIKNPKDTKSQLQIIKEDEISKIQEFYESKKEHFDKQLTEIKKLIEKLL